MPEHVAHTSAEERQHRRQYYYANSDQETGLAHLWHMQRLAAIRLSPSHTIQDAPDVDFHQRHNPVLDHHRQLFKDRHSQQLRHDEAQIRTQNAKILQHLLLASNEKARRLRNMNLVPTTAQVSRFDNINAQTSHRVYNRQVQQQILVQENQKFLGHLVSVRPSVRTAKELDKWYTVHKKRVQQISRFKPTEPFAGARVLEAAASTCSYRAAAAPLYPRPLELSAAPPLLRGHPYPPLSVAEAARTAPSSLLPAVRTTSYGGVPLAMGVSTSKDDKAGSGEATSLGHDAASHHPLQRPRGTARPDWQPISATDIPLLHYAADLQLRRDGGGGTSTRVRGGGGARMLSTPVLGGEVERLVHGAHTQSNSSSQQHSMTMASSTVRRVAPSEEGGVTQLWRQALQRPRERSVSYITAADQYPSPPL
ncbi:hypothetical protein JKF63_04879 [Porcisia hertigi]|uniref:Uncharacterized protein n=1 Tax=Porcisia hertigi TaxID=2761500 RepID=A0A836LBU3_9TRYP|nr:hypothetical protein JKF63_04879 [Porcisia hertigi]